MSGPPNDANGRVRGPMRFGRGACSARPVTSIDDPLNRTVMQHIYIIHSKWHLSFLGLRQLKVEVL